MSFFCWGSFNAFQLFKLLDEAPEAWDEVASSMNFIHVGLEHVSAAAEQFVKNVSCTRCWSVFRKYVSRRLLGMATEEMTLTIARASSQIIWASVCAESGEWFSSFAIPNRHGDHEWHRVLNMPKFNGLIKTPNHDDEYNQRIS